jgi:DNA polymerase III epsilon subunit family exonuclease
VTVSEEHWWAVDVEGNGGSPPEIVEIGLIQIIGRCRLGRSFHWLVKPVQPISSAVSRIHGLTDADVRSAPSIEDIGDDLLTWLDGATIVGHNVKVEVDIISRSLSGWLPKRAFDTLLLARLLRPGLPSYSLERLAVQFGLGSSPMLPSGRGHHSALHDAALAATLMIDLLTGLSDRDATDYLDRCDILSGRQVKLL